jgi:hypothetical protein
MDLIVALPKTRTGYDSIFTVVDRLTKMVHFIPTTSNVTTPELAKLFFNNIVRYHGLPSAIISDRDPKFTSNFWRSLFAIFNTSLKMSTAYHPETDGQTERANRTLEEILRAYVNERQDDWDQHLAAAEFAYNNSVQASTDFSPFYLNYGHHPSSPTTLIMDALKKPLSNPTVEDYLVTLRKNLETATTNIRRAQHRQKTQADKHRRDITFNTGDQVLLSTEHLNIPRPTGVTTKLGRTYIGPFTVERVISPVAYELKLPPTYRCHPVFHVSQLEAWNDGSADFTNRALPPKPPPDIIDGEPEWEVDYIINKRVIKDAGGREKTQYYVRWKGYPDYDMSWEDEENFTHAREAIEEFEQSMKARNGDVANLSGGECNTLLDFEDLC